MLACALVVGRVSEAKGLLTWFGSVVAIAFPVPSCFHLVVVLVARRRRPGLRLLWVTLTVPFFPSFACASSAAVVVVVLGRLGLGRRRPAPHRLPFALRYQSLDTRPPSLSSFRFIRPRPSLTRAHASIPAASTHTHPPTSKHKAHRAAHAQARTPGNSERPIVSSSSSADSRGHRTEWPMCVQRPSLAGLCSHTDY